MANQMQLEVILAGNRIATRVFVVRTDGQAYGHMITKFSRMGILPHFLMQDETGKWQLFLYPCFLKY